MRKLAVLSVLFLVFALGIPAVGQQDPGSISRLFLVKAKPGMAQQFEEGYKKHIAWHRQQKDDWAWDTWVYQSGDRFGQYIIRTGNHHWKDFDERGDFGKADAANFRATSGEYVASTRSMFTRALADVSRFPEGDETFPIIQATAYQVHLGHEANFLHALGKYREAVEKTNRPAHYVVVQTLNGAEGPAYTIVSFRKSWAALEPLEKTIEDMMVEVFSQREWESLRDMFLGAVRSSESNILRYRPELSYQPTAPTSD